MGSSCTKSCNNPSHKSIHSKFHTQDLHAPLFHKHGPEVIDPKANHKYCPPDVIQNIANEFKAIDTDASGDISFEEFKASDHGKNISDVEAREIFNRIDLNQNKVLEFDEFERYQGLTQTKTTNN